MLGEDEFPCAAPLVVSSSSERFSEHTHGAPIILFTGTNKAKLIGFIRSGECEQDTSKKCIKYNGVVCGKVQGTTLRVFD